MLSVGEVSFDDRVKRRIAQVSVHQPVEQGRETGDRGCDDDSIRTDDAAGFRERRDALVTIGDVVERPQEEHDVVGVIAVFEVASISERRGEQRAAGRGLTRLLDVERHGVDEMDAVSRVRQPARVRAGAAADVERRRGRWRQVASEELRRSGELDPRCPGLQAIALVPGPVVGDHRVVLHGVGGYGDRRPTALSRPSRRSARSLFGRTRTDSTSEGFRGIRPGA